MRNYGTRGYSGYRGRRPSGRRWLVVVLVLILLVATGFLVAQHYMVYDMDGSYHFELPFLRRIGSKGTGARGGQDIEIVIERPEASSAEAQQQTLCAAELDASALSGDMRHALEALGPEVNAVAIRLKTADGDLLYPSTLSAALEAKAVTGSSIAGSAVSELTKSDRYTIARLTALHDSRFSFAHMTDAAIEQKSYKNYIWYAPDNSFYLAPEKELARQYLVSIASEVASLGFDELLFDEFGYPAVGRLNNIQTSEREMTKEEALSLLADNLREALSDSGARLSLVLDEKTVLDGKNAKTGQDLSVLAPRFDRIYVPTTENNIPKLLAALAPYGAELVPILSAAPASGPYLISE